MPQVFSLESITSSDSTAFPPFFNSILRSPVLRPAIEKITGLSDLDRFYSSISGEHLPAEFALRTLNALGVELNVTESDLARIPASGPTLVIANHPFGLLDPVAMISILAARRKDLKIITNRMLASVNEVKDICIFVDPFGGPEAKVSNIAAMRDAMRWISKGGMVALFPAGEVASFDLRKMTIVEREWTNHVAKLLHVGKASALPMFFKGTNSLLFHLGGLVHPAGRTAMLARELLNKKRVKLTATFGNPISYRRLSGFASDMEMVEHLRMRTLLLENRLKKKKVFSMKGSNTRQAKIEESGSVEALQAEIAGLPKEKNLLAVGPLQVYGAEAYEIPNILREIGRLREITFREVGEGTGNAFDLDVFDQYYLHIFIWNSEKNEVVGAYRAGRSDKIASGKANFGLYTKTLFNYSSEFLNRIAPALELGRSWIRKEYQKSSIALALLWRGIGAYVAANPRYKILFGPVSISSDYSDFSQTSMIHFLKENAYHAELASEVKCRNPFKGKIPVRIANSNFFRNNFEDATDFSEFISDLETDGKGIPVLIKEYLKLGGQIAGFNVDKDFCNAVDGLILVDLRKTNTKVLERYLGKEGAQKFTEYHGRTEVAA